MIGKVFGFLFQPHKTWQSVSAMSEGQLRLYLLYPALLALLPAAAWYVGTTRVGWQVGDGNLTRLTTDSALMIAVLYYLAQIIAIWVVGYFIHWMAATYEASSTLIKGLVIAGFCATPLLVAGAVGFYPLFTLDMLVGIAATCYAVYLLYIGIPIAMNMPQERGFLFASAVVAVGLVGLVVLMSVTVILWDMGYAPAFTD